VGSVRTILASLFTALGGLFLLALTAGVGFALYLAAAPESISATAAAEAVSTRPLVRAQPAMQAPPEFIRTASTFLPNDPPAPTQDSNSRIREMQKALARAQCYKGPINGVWSDASKDAMRGFLQAVNSALPVDAPDDALIALVESNDAAKCASGRAIETGSLGSTLQVSAGQASPRLASAEAPLPQSDANDAATRLDRPWAPAGMLTVPEQKAIAPPIVRADGPSKEVVQTTTASADVTPAPVAAPQATPAPHFEGGAVLDTQLSAESAAPGAVDPRDAQGPSAKPKKTKSAKRRPAKDDDVETTISNGFETLQRSIASMF
jgi:hypothetical protein